MAKPSTIDAYLAGLPSDQRAALAKVRAAIRAAAPDAEEVLSYGVPAFREGGGMVAGFGAGANHVSYYPMSGTVVATLAGDLKAYETSKAAIRFSASKPLPGALVKKLVQARRAEIVAARGRQRKPSVRKSVKKASKKAAKKATKRKGPA